MLTFLAATMAATGALLNALVAHRTYKIHQENRVDVIRPEVILHGWTVREIGTENVLCIERLTNLGRGPALSFGINATAQNSSNKISYKGENLLRDIRPGEEIHIDLAIPIQSCLRQRGADYFGRVILRLFWTDLHEKKHLVDLLVQINMSGTVLAPNVQVHVLDETRHLFMLARKAYWFNSERKFKAALKRPAVFD